MSAQSFDVATCLFADPTWSPGTSNSLQCLNDTVSFVWTPNYAIRTLSTSNAVTGQDLSGLLYVPDLDPSDPCNNITQPRSNLTYVPANVTRQSNLPHANYNLVAIAPWISPTCTLSYLDAAQQDSPLRAMLFYKPNNDTNTPPIADDPQWDLGDGAAWKTKYQFPVYAIPGPTGSLFMQELAKYSGNMTSVPSGATLVKSYDSTNYVRLYAHIGVGSYSSLPSLWVFLLIVLGILALVIALTSVLMHYLQGRRRASLRRRVANGEVDLEALGIQRLTVPQDLLDRMPLYEYGSGESVEKPKSEIDNKSSMDVYEKETSLARGGASKSRNNPEPPSTDTAARPRVTTHPALQNRLHQPTCAICLDDFVESSPETSGTVVRQLPCLHIFHPECVDTFLRDNSSLCPLCKKSALPKGYCPKVVTNAMVRRERMVRRIRETVVVDEDNAQSGYNTNSPGGIRGLGNRVGALGRRTRPATSTSVGQPMADLSSTAHTGPDQNGPLSPAIDVTQTPPENPATRREWAQRRAVAMLGRREAPVEPEAEERRSGWRKVVRSVFPGMS